MNQVSGPVCVIKTWAKQSIYDVTKAQFPYDRPDRPSRLK